MSNGASLAAGPVAYHARMRSGGKACWKTILFEGGGAHVGGELSRPERLAALYRFQNGEAPGDVRLVDPQRKAVVTDPAEIDWTHFPVVDALEAVTREELHRLRSLLHAEQHPPTPPQGLVWGVDLRNAALRGDGATEA